ncbi:4-(cytidine 5'-diphospho)-2-C-methyl-D-erythritol kinase [Erythrobacter sp.]|uniref:4-(cytidine 5'-diphospho)-2-C-methyl-D-erythritol kinase n=1 Tax=Erythrobacter sp. TaxID=1042 RepID=UPI002E992FAD|nr:4-(cytidine 5'-diphospho)-2-C-methyl-D-erythritol kinase [Erythrobacter sp.]
MKETAYAKINLALHVRARREDGYHEIETLFAFVNAGDVLVARASQQDRVTAVGAFASGIEDSFDNLVAKALSVLPRPQGLDVTLEKNLPVAAGLGGGSADAAAMFRIVEQMHGLPDDWPRRAAQLGADVPCCVRSELAIGRGTGTQLEPIENDMTGMAVLLVNPRTALATGPVFGAWDGQDRGGLPEGSARQIAREGRNDLRAPAIARCPAIADILSALGETDPWICEMSGSGATCFALYESDEARDRAAEAIAQAEQNWWMMMGKLR